MKKMYRIIRHYYSLKKIVPEIVPLWLKIGVNAFIWKGYARGSLYEGELIRGVTKVVSVIFLS